MTDPAHRRFAHPLLLAVAPALVAGVFGTAYLTLGPSPQAPVAPPAGGAATPATSDPSTTASETPSPPRPTPAASDDRPPVPSDVVAWGPGPVLLGSVDFDAQPPRVEAPRRDLDVFECSDHTGTRLCPADFTETVVAVWAQTAPADQRGCHETLATRAQDPLSVELGDVVCLRTEDGAVGKMELESEDEDGTINALVTMWQR